MQKFVGRKNDFVGAQLDGETQNHDDLKMKMPTGPSKQRNPQASKSRGIESAHQVKEEPRDEEEMQLSAHHEGYRQRPFYGTDASSIDESSVTASLKQEGEKAWRAEHYQEAGVEPAGEDSEGEEVVDDVSEPEPNSALQMPPRLREMEADLQRGQLNVYGANFRQTKGDSYPTTTSGVPSIPDAPDNARNGHADPKDVHEANARSNLRISRHHADDAPKQSGPDSVGSAQVRSTQPSFQRPKTSHHNVNENPVAPTFQYGRPNLPHQQFGKSSAIPSYHCQPPTTNRALGQSNNTAQPSSLTSRSGGVQQVQPDQHAQPGMKDTQRKLPLHNRSRSRVQEQRRPPQEYEMVPQRAATPEPVHIDRHGEKFEQETQNGGEYAESQLDYDHAALSSMDYHDLKAQPFDIDPNAKTFELPNGQHGSLTDKMAAIAKSQPQHQKQFFESLSIEEWEQAGDWFLDQFSDIFGGLKNVRKEKRKAAHGFEAEIEGRYDAVGRKRKQIDAALGDMRESGGKVLQSTPKKTRSK